LWAFHVGAPPPVRKRTPARTPSQPQSHPGRVLLRFRACPTDTPLRAFHVGAPPRGETEPRQNPEPAPIAPGAGAPTVQSVPHRHAAAGISCRSTAPVRNGAQSEPRASPNRTRGGCSYGSEHAPPTRRYGYSL